MYFARCAVILALMAFSSVVQAGTGFIVLAPDRGFVGNNQTREAFESFAADFDARLVFVTDERGEPYFRRAVEQLAVAGHERAVLMPMYLTEAHPDFALIDAWQGRIEALELVRSRIFGHSHLAPRVLGDRIESAGLHGGRLVVLGHGARDAEGADAMAEELARIARAGADRFHFDRVEARVVAEGEDMEEALSDLGEGDQVLPFHLGPMFSEMMAYSRWLRRSLPAQAAWIEGGVTPHGALPAWMRREANRHLPVSDERLGVIVHAHGAGFHWNETMREAAAPLAEDHLLEFAFSMGGAGTLERAVRRLEKRGARAVVIVRVFSMADSFLDGIERFIGVDYESCRASSASPSHGHGHGHGQPARLLTGLPVVTTGGLEDHPFFARALLERARALSEEPGRETIILVAHGKGDDEGNALWLELLGSLREQMLAAGGDDFREIRVGTWREDWPDKREAAIEAVRRDIEAAQRDGGRAIVVPARTTSQGPARELLPDLEFELGEGFAPHPLFVEWLREQVAAGLEQLEYGSTDEWRCSWEDVPDKLG